MNALFKEKKISVAHLSIISASSISLMMKLVIITANIGLLIDCARQRGQWDFFCRTKQLLLISCLEDSTNEVWLSEWSQLSKLAEI